MNDWLSLPSGEMVRVSEIAAVEMRHAEVGKHSQTSALILKNGQEIRTPWQVSDVQRQIMAVEQKMLREDITPQLEWHLSKRVLEAYVNYRNTAWASDKCAVTLAEWLGMVAEDYLALQARDAPEALRETDPGYSGPLPVPKPQWTGKGNRRG